MSKSVGNVVDPRSIIEGGKDKNKEPALGADVLRLWVSSVDYTGHLPKRSPAMAACHVRLVACHQEIAAGMVL